LPPGGQGGLHFKVKSRPMYPDIIAFKDGVMIVGENKPSYSESDKVKLKELLDSEDLLRKGQEILNDYSKSHKLSFRKIEKIEIFLGFAICSIFPQDGINFFHVNQDGKVTVLKG
jgi:hypothetical protein